MRIIGIDGFEVFIRMSKDEYSTWVKKIANMDNDRSEDDS